MKKHLLSILTAFIFLSSIAMAQPILTATGINPVVGDTYALTIYYEAVSQGNAGANQSWTVMPVSSGNMTIYDSYAPSSTPYASSFPLANYCETDGTYFHYMKTSSLAYRAYGVAGSSSNTQSYSDPEDVLRFPFNMNDTYTDTWYGPSTTGTTTVTYDGYGSLTIPSGTYNNVVRVHYSRTQIFYSDPIVHYADGYSWLLNGNHQTIASTHTFTADNGSPPFMMATVLTGAIVTNVNGQDELSSYIISYPNPAVNEINFELSNVIRVKQIEIVDITGKSVYNKPISQSMIENVITINTSDFKDGIYFAKFELEGGQSFAKKISILK